MPSCKARRGLLGQAKKSAAPTLIDAALPRLAVLEGHEGANIEGIGGVLVAVLGKRLHARVLAEDRQIVRELVVDATGPLFVVLHQFTGEDRVGRHLLARRLKAALAIVDAGLRGPDRVGDLRDEAVGITRL